MSCPVEMPPSTPPALLDRNTGRPFFSMRMASRLFSSPDRAAAAREARAEFDALDRRDAHHRLGDVGIEAVEHRRAEASGDPHRRHLDDPAELRSRPCARPSRSPPPRSRPLGGSGEKNGLRPVSSRPPRLRSMPCGPIWTRAPGAFRPPGPCARSRRPRPGWRSRGHGAAAAPVVADAVLGLVGEVGVAGTELVLDPP